MNIEDLPQPYPDLAMKRKNPININDRSGSLVTAFQWMDTPEGGTFWSLCNSAKTADELPPLPVAQEEAA